MHANRSLLVVEDNPDDEAVVRRALRELGHSGRVQVVGDGAQALSAIYEGRAQPVRDLPALVLLDLRMPTMNGFEFLRAIRTDPLLVHLPVVVFTSSAQTQDIQAAYELGATAYVQKPMEYSRLVDMLRGILGFWFHLTQPRPRALERLQRAL